MHQLEELIEAIDRRLPQVERVGELEIAKAALQLLGRDSGELRLPLVEASEPTRRAIAAAATKLGLL